MSEEINYTVIRQFGPSVFKVKIPQSIMDKLNDHIDQLIQNKKKQSNLNWGHKLVGDVTEEFLLEKEIIEKSGWLNFLSICVQRWINIETQKKITKFISRTAISALVTVWANKGLVLQARHLHLSITAPIRLRSVFILGVGK